MEFEELKTIIGDKKLVIRNCGFCGYPCGYLFHDGKLYYDIGCDCTPRPPKAEEREEKDLLWFINTNSWDENKVKENLKEVN